MPGINFTAIDVETANSKRGSICAVGMAQVREGQVVKVLEWHVRLPEGMGTFEQRNIDIHGITPEMVQSANSWKESLEAIEFLAEGFPLVAYNAPFDNSAIRQASEFAGLTMPTNPFHCALNLSRRLVDLESYKLPVVAAALGADPFDHHSAGSDAVACAQVVLALAKQENAQSISGLWPPAATRSNTTVRQTRSFEESRPRLADLPQPHTDASSDHPFFGCQVIITGGLETCNRTRAMELIALHGGTNGNGVTKRTRFLVVGGQTSIDPASALKGSSKERKAAEYISQGQDIKVLTEREFLQLVGPPESDVERLTAQRSRKKLRNKAPLRASDAAPSYRQSPAATRSETHADRLRHGTLMPPPNHLVPPAETLGSFQETAPVPPDQASPLQRHLTKETHSTASNLLLVTLWVLLGIGAIGALLFGAIGIAYFAEGAPESGWTGIFIGILCAALAFLSGKIIGNRKR